MRRLSRRPILAGLVGLSTVLRGETRAAAQQDGPADVLAQGADGVLNAGLIARHGDGRLALAQAAGPRRPGRDAPPFGLDDPFRVASVSKMVATVAFMQAVEAGQVGLDDDVTRALGFRLRHPANPDRSITWRAVLSHTSGLRNGPSYPVPAGGRLVDVFTSGTARFDGGAWFAPTDQARPGFFAYADVNFCLMAQALERITGLRFDRILHDQVLAPLGLDAGYNWSGVSQAKRDRVAPACRWRKGGWAIETDAEVPPAPHVFYTQPKDGPAIAEQDLRLGENGFLFAPQGGLRVSLKDMDRLAAFFRQGGARIVRQESLDLMQTPVWVYDAKARNGETGEGGKDDGVFAGYGLATSCPQHSDRTGDAFFGADSPDWRGHLGDAYGWLTGLFWNRKDGRTLVWAINGVRETERPLGRRSALSLPEERIIDMGLAALS